MDNKKRGIYDNQSEPFAGLLPDDVLMRMSMPPPNASQKSPNHQADIFGGLDDAEILRMPIQTSSKKAVNNPYKRYKTTPNPYKK